MKRFEKLAIILIIIWLIQACTSFFTVVILRDVIAGGDGSISFVPWQNLVLTITTASTWLTALACGIWLYLEAKREQQSKWIWCLAGLIFKLPAIMIFFAYIILNTIRNTDPNQGMDLPRGDAD